LEPLPYNSCAKLKLNCGVPEKDRLLLLEVNADGDYRELPTTTYCVREVRVRLRRDHRQVIFHRFFAI
jgi:hypothetical protein